MSRSINLRKSITNQIIDDMIHGSISSPIPSQTTLAELYNISRTTIRAITNELIKKGILSTVNGAILINRAPQNKDKYQLINKDDKKIKKVLLKAT